MSANTKRPSWLVTIVVLLAIAVAFLYSPSKPHAVAPPPPSAAAPTAPATQASRSDAVDPVPSKVRDVLAVVLRTGRPPSGYRGGTVFSNDGRGSGETLPRRTADGDAITYREWDVNPYRRGVNRGAERLVTGSSGLAYYTADHYRTFVRIP